MTWFQKVLICTVALLVYAGLARANENEVFFIAEHEEFRRQAYFDAGGVLTIGFGTTNNSNCIQWMIEPDTEYTYQEALDTLTCEVEIIRQQIRELTDLPLPKDAERALISFVYNVGIQNYKTSTLLKKIRARDFVGAAEEFDRWIYCNGVVLQGLRSRRASERALFESGFEVR